MSKIKYDKRYSNPSLGGTNNPVTYDSSWTDWNNQSGEEILSFIKDKLESAVVDLEFRNQQLIGKNSFGTEVCNCAVLIMTPIYETTMAIAGFRINGVNCEANTAYPYKETSTYEVGIQLVTGFQTQDYSDIITEYSVRIVLGNKYDTFKAYSVPKGSGLITWVDVTSLVKANTSSLLSSFTIAASANPTFLDSNLQPLPMKEGGVSSTSSTYSIVKLKLNFTGKSNILTDNTLTFLVDGVNTKDYKLQYYADTVVNLATSNNNRNYENGNDITSGGLVSLVLPTSGVYEVFARAIHKTDPTISSDWELFNVIAALNYSGSPLIHAFDIASTAENCDSAPLFTSLVYPANGGSTEIKSYLSDDVSTLFDNEFKSVQYNNLLDHTKESDKTESFTSYNEFHEISPSGEARFLGIKINIDGTFYTIKKFKYASASNRISVSEYFDFIITQPEENKLGELQYIDDSYLKKNFNQVNLQSNNIFESANLDPDLGSNDGYTVGSKTGFKVSALYVNEDIKDVKTGLFNTPINLKDLLISTSGFTLEFEYKTSNNNGDSPAFSVGSLFFGAGYCRLNTNDEDKNAKVSFWKNSKASYSKDNTNHIIITYLPNYKPSTYENSVYLDLFPGYKSEVNLPYNILRIYVDGCINREIRLDDAVRFLSGNWNSANPTFNFLIHPTDSDVEFYTIRTYNKALNYQEVKQNHLSVLSTLAEKRAYLTRNDILNENGEISLYKAAQKYNVAVMVIPDGTGKDSAENPLWYGNVTKEGSGETDYLTKNRTILINYSKANKKDAEDDYYTKYSGRYTDFEYKALGSSAKKYMLAHNVQASKGKWLTLLNIDLVKAGAGTKALSSTVPIPNCNIEAKKMVGKVNTASSMQSHKIGAVKLFNDCWFANGGTTYTPGNDKTRIAVYLDPFLYFYAKVPDPSTIESIEDLYTVTNLGNGQVSVEDTTAHFFGFWTWGSGKADKPQFGYGDDTPEYILIEGADNGSPGANFNQPWASFLRFDSLKAYDNLLEAIQLPKSVTETDPYTGLLIYDETLRFENSTDPWDFDYGVDAIKDELGNKTKFFLFNKYSKNSMNYFIKFYNAMYEYDYTDFVPWNNKTFNVTVEKDSDGNVIDSRDLNLRYYFAIKGVSIIDGDSTLSGALFDVYRYDAYIGKFVPAGLHYVGNKWETYNLVTAAQNFKNTDLGKEIGIGTVETAATTQDINNNILPAYKKMFEGAINKYVDVDNLAYHQAFMKIVSGTDNRAKNTYFTIFGKRYSAVKTLADGSIQHGYKLSTSDEYDGVKGYVITKGEVKGDFIFDSPLTLKSGTIVTKLPLTTKVTTKNGEKTVEESLTDSKYYPYQSNLGDYKIRFMLDDTDTIFETDNNGQQLKPHYLLEPPFNKDTEIYWGDCHSSLFYPFDISFEEKVMDKTAQLVEYLIGNNSTLMAPESKFYLYFFSVLEYFPEVAYNHTAEIYYELSEVFFSNGSPTYSSDASFRDSLSGFGNNSVPYPLSLSHGSCLNSEIQFMTDRLCMLGSMTKTANGLRKDVNMSGGDSGGSTATFNLTMEAMFTDYVAPGICIRKSGGYDYCYMATHTDKENTYLAYDPLINDLSAYVPYTLRHYVVPNYTYSLVSDTLTENISNAIVDYTKYKEVKITGGLLMTSFLIQFPNASKVVIDNVANYKIANTTCEFSKIYPSIEDLLLKGVNFSAGDVTLDFRNCSRLKSVDLTGCKGISTIIIPDNKNLELLIIPGSVTTLSLGYTPKLTSENFINNDCKLNNLTIDAGNIHLLHSILEESVSDSPENLVINNVKNKYVWMPADILKIILGFSYVNYAGTIYIGDSSNCINTKTGKYVESEGLAISWEIKEQCAKKFGDIDSISDSQKVKIKYVSLEITLAIIANEINIYTSCIPSYSLRLNGNNVKIKGNSLDITYKISNVSSGATASVDSATGYITLTKFEDKTSARITITINTTSGAIVAHGDVNSYCIINFGFTPPELGNFAYDDGTFSKYYNPSKTLIGFVYYVKPDIDKINYEVRVMSAKASSTTIPFGPCRKSSYSLWYDLADKDLENNRANVTDFLTKLSLADSFFSNVICESHKTISNSSIYYDENLATEITKYKVDSTYTLNSGEICTESYITKANNVIKELIKAGKPTNKMTTITKDNYKDLISLLDDYKNSSNFMTVDGTYGLTLFPAVLEAYYYIPASLKPNSLGNYPENYSKYKEVYTNNWYIPSIEEIDWLIRHVINGQLIGPAATSNNYWSSTSWISTGDSFFVTMNNEVSKASNTSMSKIIDFLGTSNKVSAETQVDGVITYGDPYYYTSSSKLGWQTTASAVYSHNTNWKDSTTLKIIPCTKVIISRNDNN